MVYLIAHIILLPEKLQEFSELLEKEYLPVVQKHGSKLVACWRVTIGNLDEVIDVWEYESLEKFEKIRQSQFQDPAYRKARQKIRTLMREEILKLASPLSFSPLK